MMGSSSSAHDAKASLGYNPRLLTGERLARMKACAEKASTTFPPAFVNKPQPEDEATTPAGDDALARGRWANERRKPAPRDSGSPRRRRAPRRPLGPDGARRRHGPDPRGLPDGRGARPRARRARRVRHDRVVEEKRTLPRNRRQVLYALRAPLLQPLREPTHARALRHARPGHGGQRHGAARRPRRRRARSRRENDVRERA